jgi:hypothetical protein
LPKSDDVTGFRLTNWPEFEQYGCILAKLGQIPVKLTGIWFAGIRQQRLEVAGFRFTSLVIFSYMLNTVKYFTSKQTKHKTNTYQAKFYQNKTLSELVY